MERKQKSMGGPSRYILRYILRSPGKSLLCLALASIFMSGLMLIRISTIRSEGELERLYNTIPVEMEVITVGTSYSSTPISQYTVNQIQDTGYMIASYLVSGGSASQFISYDSDGEVKARSGIPGLKGIDDPDEFFDRERLGDYKVTYAEGIDEGIFQEALSAAPAVLLPQAMMEQLDIQLGEKIEIVIPKPNPSAPPYIETVIVAGVYSCASEKDVLMSRFDLRRLPGITPAYRKAIFTIDPKFNRQMDMVREELSQLVQKGSSDSANLTAIYWDQELRQAIAPMEQVISFMKALYPVTLGLSFIVAAGIAVLLSLLSAKEAAILRVLGNSKTTCRVILCLQTILPCIVGLVIGHLGAVAMAYLMLPAEDAAGLMFPALGRVGLYLLYTVLGAVGASAVMTGKNPLELLQVKE